MLEVFHIETGGACDIYPRAQIGISSEMSIRAVFKRLSYWRIPQGTFYRAQKAMWADYGMAVEKSILTKPTAHAKENNVN